MMLIVLFLLVGVIAGLLAGALGLGGGVVIVPALIFVFAGLGFPLELVAKMAVATSLSTILVTSVSAVRTHHRAGFVRWPLVAQLSVGIVIGALLGAMIADRLPGDWLTRLFGIFAIAVSLQMLLAGRKPPTTEAERLPRAPAMAAVGGVIGTGSALFGIGGGSLTVPFLTACRVTMQQAVAVSSACGLPIALAGTAGFMWVGLGHAELPSGSLGYVYLPATLAIIVTSTPAARFSARWSHRVPAATLKRLFALVLMLIGLRLIAGL